MLFSFVLSVICILAVLGFVSVIYTIFNCNENNMPIVVGTYNQQEQIEGIIREKMRKYPKTLIIVVDLGSTDDTVKIIKMLERDNSCVKLVDRYHHNVLLR